MVLTTSLSKFTVKLVICLVLEIKTRRNQPKVFSTGMIFLFRLNLVQGKATNTTKDTGPTKLAYLASEADQVN